MGLLFNFGEDIKGFEFKVINERDARASAGIMFLLGTLSLFAVFVNRTIFWAELFSITFIVEFIIRTLFNPKYAPYMLIGGLIVSNQEPDWVDAKPKQFAWVLGLVLGLIMGYYILFDVISLVRLSICFVCLGLLYLESVFGICLGCILYQKLNIEVNNCPGGVCEISSKEPYNRKNLIYILGFAILFGFTYWGLKFVKYSDVQKVVIVRDIKD